MIEIDYLDIEGAKEKIRAIEERKIAFCDYIKLKAQLKEIEYEMTNNYEYSNRMFLYKLNIISTPPIPYFQLYGCECRCWKNLCCCK